MKSIGIGSKLRHNQYGDGILCKITLEYLSISFNQGGIREIPRDSSELTVIETLEPENNQMTFDEVEDVLIRILKKYIEPEQKADLGQKWKGGQMILQPSDKSLKGKEVPIETFFHKIVMLRDRLRVLEQQINSHKILSDEEKVNMQQYITRCYGSLTTFNVLFKHENDWFKGDSKD